MVGIEAAPGEKALNPTYLDKVAAHVEQLLDKPDWVLDATTEEAQKAAAEARKLVKLFFDAAQARCPPKVQELSDLGQHGIVVKGFDHEQIWEELEVQNIPLRRHLRARIAKVVRNKVSLKGATGTKKEAAKGARLEEEDSEAGPEEEDDEPEPEVTKKSSKKKKGQKDEDEGDDVVVEKKSQRKGKSEKSAGDEDEEAPALVPGLEDDPDDPFSIEAMNRFADEAEQNMRLDEDAGSSDFDLLEMGSDDDDEEGKEARFDDFFDRPEESEAKKPKKAAKKEGAPAGDASDDDDDDEGMLGLDDEDGEGGLGDEESEEEDGEEAEEEYEPQLEELSDEEKELEAKLDALQNEGGDITGDEEGDDGEDPEEESDAEGGGAKKAKGERSLYDMDKTLRSLEEEVAKLEDEQLAEKPWMLKGEVNAKQRPLNSLLETHLEKPMSFFAGRRAEAAVESTGGGSEDEAAMEDVRGAADLAPRKKLDIDAIVRQRIWDEVFDDVVRKFQLPPSQRKRKEEEDLVETLNFEKSRVGLGDVYAKQYEAELLGHKTDQQEKEDKDKAEAKALFTKLMFKLDQLTNAHFTPRPPMLGIANDAVAKVPALKMEETIPLMVSDAHLKAPEELKAPRRHAREQEELTHDERAAKRRLKKAARKKELERKVDTGKMTLSGMRERAEVLNKKNKEAKLEKEKKGVPREARKKIKGSEMMAQAQAADTSKVSRKEELRKERMQRPDGALPSKRLKL